LSTVGWSSIGRAETMSDCFDKSEHGRRNNSAVHAQGADIGSVEDRRVGWDFLVLKRAIPPWEIVTIETYASNPAITLEGYGFLPTLETL
jgi:hypothetical protein